MRLATEAHVLGIKTQLARAIVPIGIGWIAYLDASGLSSLLAAGYLPIDIGRLAPASDADPAWARQIDPPERPNGERLLALFGMPGSISPATRPCDGMRALIITESSGDPGWSMATLSGEKVGGRIVRAGDDFEGLRVARFGFDPESFGPAVWLENAAGVCRLALRASADTNREIPSTPAGIRRTGESEVVIDRGLVKQLISDRATLARHVRMIHDEDGRFIAELRAVDSQSVPFAIGFRDGDRLRTVNGHDVTTPEGSLRAYTELQRCERLAIEIERGGRRQTLEIEIAEPSR